MSHTEKALLIYSEIKKIKGAFSILLFTFMSIIYNVENIYFF